MPHVLPRSAVLTLLTAVARAENLLPSDQGNTRIRPDPRPTPGAVTTSDPAVFCHAGHSRSVGQTSGRVKRLVCRACGIDRRSGHYGMDHPGRLPERGA